MSCYRLVLHRGRRAAVQWDITLDDGQTWRAVIPAGGGDALSADLYRLPDLAHPYRYVAVDVGAAATP